MPHLSVGFSLGSSTSLSILGVQRMHGYGQMIETIVLFYFCGVRGKGYK